jgi:hypothetical protein
MITEASISRMVGLELDLQDSGRRFGQSPIRRHVHNGTDSLNAQDPTRVFSGFVPSDGDVSGATTNGFRYLPEGWSVQVSGGTYIVFHFLGTQNYAVLPQQDGGETVGPWFVATNVGKNSFTVTFFNTLFAIQAVDFRFIVVQVDNKNLSPQPYTASNP